jgi:hypothetical protein
MPSQYTGCEALEAPRFGVAQRKGIRGELPAGNGGCRPAFANGSIADCDGTGPGPPSDHALECSHDREIPILLSVRCLLDYSGSVALLSNCRRHESQFGGIWIMRPSTLMEEW